MLLLNGAGGESNDCFQKFLVSRPPNLAVPSHETFPRKGIVIDISEAQSSLAGLRESWIVLRARMCYPKS